MGGGLSPASSSSLLPQAFLLLQLQINPSSVCATPPALQPPCPGQFLQYLTETLLCCITSKLLLGLHMRGSDLPLAQIPEPALLQEHKHTSSPAIECTLQFI